MYSTDSGGGGHSICGSNCRVLQNGHAWPSTAWASNTILHSLHWLRIKYRIDFKINTLVYKTLHTNQPVYLRELLSLSEKQRTRASGTRELIRPRSPKTKAGSRAFYVVATYLWNSLPAEVRTAETYSIFRKKLKTHFFASCFPS